MADEPDAQKHMDGLGLMVDSIEGIAEAGLAGTIGDVVLVAVSNLPIVVVPAAQAPMVALALAAIVAMVQIGKAFRRNRF